MKEHHAANIHSHVIVDPTITSTERGLWATKWSSIGLLLTAALQLAVVLASHSVALLADSIHNFGDSATGIPLAIAFLFARRSETRRFTFGFGRVEDLAGLAIILTILASAGIAGYEAVDRLFHPRPVHFLGAVIVASIVGFLGNELVAIFRIRVGRQIGSAALVADGYHARTDGWTSLAVLVGAVGVYFGYRWADSVIGLLITVAILGVVWQSGKAILSRALDGVEPEVIDEVRHAAQHVPGVLAVGDVRARWIGHRLRAEVSVTVDPKLTVVEGHGIAKEVEHQIQQHLRFLTGAVIHVDPDGESGERFHRVGPHTHDGLAVHSH
jgi:cation diffusion facilitator family transporter